MLSQWIGIVAFIAVICLKRTMMDAVLLDYPGNLDRGMEPIKVPL